MRKNKILRQTISYALLLSIVMSILTQAIDVKVSRGVSLGNDPAWTASNLRESEIDAKRDMLNLTPAGNWAEACGPNSTYRLPWNAFHNAVIEQLHDHYRSKGYETYDSIRGVFTEGESVYPGSGFVRKTHTQICIVNPNCIKGYFAPRERKEEYRIP